MTNENLVFYMQQLKRKTSVIESDIERVEQQMKRPGMDRQAINRLKLEHDYLMIRLRKVQRGLLY